jgi:uncharacterized membrane protein YedE/YeeE
VKALSAIVAGVLFGVGLVLSGMTDPHRVRAFLDVTGAWDPTLAFVMGGAIVAHAPVVWWIRRRGRAALGPLDLPTATAIDARLLGGAAIFGLGWGLSGYCPGPALVSLVGPSAGIVIFIICMIGGVLLGGYTPVAKKSRSASLTARVTSR